MDRRYSFNGNAALKPVGAIVTYTQDEVNEMKKCKNDPVYFIGMYCKIISLDRGVISFDLYDCQKKYIDMIHNNRKLLVLVGRQSGKTTVAAAYLLWYILFNKAKVVGIAANKSAAAREVLSRLQFMYEELPEWMQQGVITWNKGDIELENKSKVLTSATNGSSFRGKSINFLYVDEAAFIPRNAADAFFASVYPTISSGTTSKILMSSTPQGYNHYWMYWNDALENRNDFKTLFIEYKDIPGRDAKWLEEQRRQLGELKFQQEVLCSFLGSSLTLIPSDCIRNASGEKYLTRSPVGYDVLHKPVKDHVYVMVVDTSEGVSQDYSTFTIIDISMNPFKIVAKFKNNTISPLHYPDIIHKVAKEYNEAFVLIEINKSEQVAYILHSEYEYENILRVSTTPKGQKIGGKNSTYGVKTSKQVKRIGCNTLRNLVEEGRLVLNDDDVIAEATTFIERKGSYSADDGYHDDLIMTLVLFAWLTNDPTFKDLTNFDVRRELYENQIKDIEDSMVPFGFIDDGLGTYDQDNWL